MRLMASSYISGGVLHCLGQAIEYYFAAWTEVLTVDDLAELQPAKIAEPPPVGPVTGENWCGEYAPGW